MADGAAAGPRDADVERRLAELDELLARVEQIPGPTGALALEAVSAVVEIYGAALSRALLLARSPEAFTGDPLLGHLLLVHGMHPDPVDVGVSAEKMGRSSVVYRVGLFQGDAVEAAAEGRFVHVYVDNIDPARPVVPMPEQIRAAVEPLLRP